MISPITDLPAKAADCPDCHGSGVVEGNSCTCEYPYAVPDAGHHPACGLEPCPRGCEYKVPGQ